MLNVNLLQVKYLHFKDIILIKFTHLYNEQFSDNFISLKTGNKLR
jgi:hypothetical protein